MAEKEYQKIYLKPGWDARVRLTSPNPSSNPGHSHHFVGREHIVDRLKNDIIHKKGWTYLVSGVRGSGKTSTVIHAINEAWKVMDEEPDEPTLLPLLISASHIGDLVHGDGESERGLRLNPNTLLYSVIHCLSEALSPNGFFQKEYLPEVQKSKKKRLKKLTKELQPDFEIATRKVLASEYSEQAGKTVSSNYGGGVDVYGLSIKMSKGAEKALKTSLRYDNTLGCVQHDLMDILRKIESNGFKLVVVFDELDKVELHVNLNDIIRTFKGFFGDTQALFFFVTDKQYYEHIEKKIAEAKKQGQYSIEHTFFSHRIFIPKPDLTSVKEYLSLIFTDENGNSKEFEKTTSQGITMSITFIDKDAETLANAVIFEARGHYFDLKNEIIDHLKYDKGNSYITLDKETLDKLHIVYAKAQEAITLIYQARKTLNPSGQYFNDELLWLLYRPFDTKKYGEPFTNEEFKYQNWRKEPKRE